MDDSDPDFDDVTVLHVELRRRLAARHFGAVEMEAHFLLILVGHLGHVLEEDGPQRRLLRNKQTASLHHRR